MYTEFKKEPMYFPISSVCVLQSHARASPNFVYIIITYDRGSILDHPLITVYSTLCTSYTLWTVDQVIFFHSRPYGGMMTLSQQPRCNVVHGLTPLLCGIGYVLS